MSDIHSAAVRANTPAETSTLMSDAVTSGDIERALSLFEPTACFVQLAYTAEGTEAIRSALRGLVSLRPTLRGFPEKVFVSDNIALVCGRWTLAATGPDGNPLDLTGRFTDVVRRQADGRWLFVIDNPYGVD